MKLIIFKDLYEVHYFWSSLLLKFIDFFAEEFLSKAAGTPIIQYKGIQGICKLI